MSFLDQGLGPSLTCGSVEQGAHSLPAWVNTERGQDTCFPVPTWDGESWASHEQNLRERGQKCWGPPGSSLFSHRGSTVGLRPPDNQQLGTEGRGTHALLW